MLPRTLFGLGLLSCLLAVGCANRCCTHRPATVAQAPVVAAPTPAPCCGNAPVGLPPGAMTTLPPGATTTPPAGAVPAPPGTAYAPPGGVIVPH